MVFLSCALFKQIPKGAAFGLYAGKGVMHGVKVTFSNKKTKRSWFPNVQRKTFTSQILDAKLQIRVTTNAIRCIDKAGGFDSYIYHTPEHKLQSKLGNYLKQEMIKIIAEKDLSPPPLVKRMPRPPKHLRSDV